MDSPKFSQFHVSSEAYKIVGGHEILTYIMIPKTAPSGKRPIFVKIHGGYLILGSALFPPWMPQYQLDYALRHSALLIAPNHRLMPEANGAAILSDMSDFWTWIRTDLAAHVQRTAPGIEPDLDHILVAGASAGAYLAVQSALAQPAGTFKAIIGAYPMLDVGSDFFTKPSTTPLSGIELLPASLVDDHLATMAPDAVVTAVDPPERYQLAMAVVQHGRYTEFLGRERVLYPVETIREAVELPYMFVYHGTDDTGVPVEGTVNFVERVRERFGQRKVHLHTQPGGHGFDTEVDIETPWLRDGLVRVTNVWLGDDIG